jgi:hypothetical protein
MSELYINLAAAVAATNTSTDRILSVEVFRNTGLLVDAVVKGGKITHPESVMHYNRQKGWHVTNGILAGGISYFGERRIIATSRLACEDRYPATTRGLPAILQEGECFASKFDANKFRANSIYSIWRETGESYTIPHKYIGKVVYGDISNVGYVSVMPLTSHHAQTLLKEFLQQKKKCTLV